MNAVPVDEAEIQATLEGVAGEYIPKGEAGPAPETPGQQQAPPDFSMAAAILVVIIDKVVAPNWELTDGEKDLLHTQFTNLGNVFAPHVNMDPRKVAAFGLVGACVAISLGRIDEHGFKPMRKPKPKDDQPQHVERAAPLDEAGFRTAA